MILDPSQRSQVMPLPVVLLSTISQDGICNAAPWSCVTSVLRPLDEAIMICARNYPPDVDELQQAGLKSRPSKKVKPPGIEGCLAWAECALDEEIVREKYVLVIGRVVHLEADDRFFSEEEGLDYEKAKPLCIMGGPNGMHFVHPVATGYFQRVFQPSRSA